MNELAEFETSTATCNPGGSHHQGGKSWKVKLGALAAAVGVALFVFAQPAAADSATPSILPAVDCWNTGGTLYNPYPAGPNNRATSDATRASTVYFYNRNNAAQVARVSRRIWTYSSRTNGWFVEDSRHLRLNQDHWSNGYYSIKPYGVFSFTYKGSPLERLSNGFHLVEYKLDWYDRYTRSYRTSGWTSPSSYRNVKIVNRDATSYGTQTSHSQYCYTDNRVRDIGRFNLNVNVG